MAIRSREAAALCGLQVALLGPPEDQPAAPEDEDHQQAVEIAKRAAPVLPTPTRR
ncbi:MAG TPA: hypothetical protein VE734_03140 [Terriglobales bacterium]|nr:hypothetical protein [Terriglobales bacterium]